MTVVVFYKFVAALAGMLTLALVVLILCNYLLLPRSYRLAHLDKLLTTIGLLCITVCSIISVFCEAYEANSPWYLFAIAGWVVSSAGLFLKFNRLVALRNEHRLNQFIHKNK